ncbi:hypothetical protein D3C77_377770 [compost metagenome]
MGEKQPHDRRGSLDYKPPGKGTLRFSPHPFGARLQAGCAPHAASGLTLDQGERGKQNPYSDHSANECNPPAVRQWSLKLKKIHFAGNDRQPCVAEYGVAIDTTGLIQRAHIVVVQSSKKPGMGTSLYNTDTGRDSVLNRILATEFAGVRVEFLTFNIILDLSERLEAMRFPIRLNWDDYKAKGNPFGEESVPLSDLKGTLLSLLGKGERATTVYSYNVVGGCADFFTVFDDEERQGLSQAAAQELLDAAGYQPASISTSIYG